MAVPNLSYDTDRLHVGMEDLGYKLLADKNFDLRESLAPGNVPEFREYAKSNKHFAGLKRDTPIEPGLSGEYRMGRMHLAGSVMQDVGSASGGYHAEAEAGVEFPCGEGSLDIGVGLRMRSVKVNNFIYGVSRNEANGLRKAYDAGSTVQPFISGSITFPISERRNR